MLMHPTNQIRTEPDLHPHRVPLCLSHPAPMLPPRPFPEAALKFIIQQVAFTWQAVPEGSVTGFQSAEQG